MSGLVQRCSALAPTPLIDLHARLCFSLPLHNLIRQTPMPSFSPPSSWPCSTGNADDDSDDGFDYENATVEATSGEETAFEGARATQAEVKAAEESNAAGDPVTVGILGTNLYKVESGVGDVGR